MAQAATSSMGARKAAKSSIRKPCALEVLAAKAAHGHTEAVESSDDSGKTVQSSDKQSWMNLNEEQAEKISKSKAAKGRSVTCYRPLERLEVEMQGEDSDVENFVPRAQKARQTSKRKMKIPSTAAKGSCRVQWEDEDTDPDEVMCESEESPEPKRKRFSRFEMERESSSDTEGKIDNYASDYEAYSPSSKSKGDRWKLPRALRTYAQKHYTVYHPEETLREITQAHPRPDHSFLHVEDLDDSIQAGVKSKLGKAGDKILKSDETLRRAQEKVLRIAGPLLSLHKELHKVRKGKRLNKFRLDKTLRLVEKTVVLAGQANVGVRYARRLAVTNVFTETRKEATKLLQKYDQQLQGTEELFGKAFQEKVEEDRGKESNIGLMSLQRKEHKKKGEKAHKQYPKQYGQQPFRGGPSRRGSRGGRGTGTWRARDTSRANQPAGPRYVVFVSSPTRQPGKRSEDLLPRPSASSTCGTGGFSVNPNHDRVQPDGRPSTVGLQELGEIDRRSRNSANGKGLQNSLSLQTSWSTDGAPTTVLAGRKLVNSRRNRESAPERSNSASSKLTGSVSGPFISETKKGRIKQADLQRKKVKQTRGIPPFQNGGPPAASKFAQQERVDGETGLEGRIFLRNDAPDRQEMVEVPLEEPDIRVPVPSVRPCLRTPSVHKIDEASGRVLAEIGHETHLLSGRLPSGQHESRKCSEGWKDLGGVVGEPRVHHQHPEVSDCPLPTDRVSGCHDRFKTDDSEPPRGQVRDNTTRVCRFVMLGNSLSPSIGIVDRQVIRGNGGSLTSTAVLQTASIATDPNTDEEPVLRGLSQPDSPSQKRIEMVVGEPEAIQWPEVDFNRTRQSVGDRCQQNRLGGILSRPESQWPLDEVREDRAYQCIGVESSMAGSQDISLRSERVTCACPDGQHDNGSPHKQTWGHSVEPPHRPDETAVEFLPESESDSNGRAPPGSAEHRGGCAFEEETGWKRLAARSGDFYGSEHSMDSMLNRFVCQQDEQATTTVCELESRSGRDIGGCVAQELGRGDELHVPAFLPANSVPGKNQSRQSGGSTDSAGVVSPTMVSAFVEIDGEPTSPPAFDPEVISVTGGQNPSNGGKETAEVSGLETLRERRVAQGFSDEAAALLEKSWRRGTRTAYSSAWKKWSSWCAERALDPVQAPVVPLVEFFKDMLKEGYEYNTINGFRSAVSALHEPIDGLPVGQHHLIKRTLAGIFNEKPPVPKYSDTWDVGQVLEYIEQLGPNSELSDKVLTHKLAMLLALTTANRASEIQGLNLEFMKDEGNSMEFVIHKLTKTRRVGQKPMSVVLTGLPDHPKLDVVKCVRAYFVRTHSWRRSPEQHQLLLGTVPPHKPVATSTISGWLKQFMTAAGIDTTKYQGHSTRAASTSRAKAAGLSVREIMDRANWRNAKTFHRFYDRPVAEPAVPYGTVILQ